MGGGRFPDLPIGFFLFSHPADRKHFFLPKDGLNKGNTNMPRMDVKTFICA